MLFLLSLLLVLVVVKKEELKYTAGGTYQDQGRCILLG